MSLKSQPLKKQKRRAGQAGKAVAAGVLFAAAEELLASKPVVEPQLLPELPAAPPADAAVDEAALSAAEAVAVDVPLEGAQAAAPAVSAELADLLAQLNELDGGAELAAATGDEGVLLADAGPAASDAAVAQAPAADAAAAAPASTEALAPAAEAAAPFSAPLAVVGGLGVIGLGAAIGGGSSGPRPAPSTSSTPAAATKEVSGRVIDGPVENGRVYYDANGNGEWDDLNHNGVWDQGDEYMTYTDAKGNFTLKGFTVTDKGRIVVEGGTDTETGNTIGTLMAQFSGDSASSTTLVVSPLSLVLALNPSLTQAELKAALKLPADVDLTTFDPFAAMSSGDAAKAAQGVKVFAAQQQLYSLVRAITQVTAGSDGNAAVSPAELQSALKAVGAALEQPGATLDTAVHAAVTTVVSDTTKAAQITQAVSDSAKAIETAYSTTTVSGLNLASARALVDAGDASAPHFAEAAALLATARAAASVSQTNLLTAVNNVSSGGTYTTGSLKNDVVAKAQDYVEAINDKVSPPPPQTEDTGHVTAAQLATVTSDGKLDELVAQLHAAGAEQIGLDAAQVTALAGLHLPSLDFNAGTDVVVAGTAFLTGGMGGSDVSQLLGAADVAVALTAGDMTHVLAHSDAALDDLVARLQGAGMDSLQLTASQINQLALDDGHLTLNNGAHVDVTGAFDIGTAAGEASAQQIASLLTGSDVTVHLDQADVSRVLVGGDTALDNLVTSLHNAGMDTLALDQDQVSAMAHAHMSLAAGTDVSVSGTHFLSGGATDAELHTLLNDANVTVHMTDSDFAKVLAAGTNDAALDALTTHLHNAGVDALALDPGQALALADAAQHFTFNDAVRIQLDDALTVAELASDTQLSELHSLLAAADVTAKLDIADLRQTQPNSVADVATDISDLQNALHAIGVDHLRLGDGLADSLAEADIHFDHALVPDVVVAAQADIPGSDTAYIQASLQELQALGVDHVVGAGGVSHIELAMSNSSGPAPGFNFNDLPSFREADNVDLVVTEADLEALFGNLSTLQSSLTAFSNAHIDKLLIKDATDPALASQLNVTFASVIDPLHLSFGNADLTDAQVRLLGLNPGDEPATPLDPFNKHPAQS